MNSYWGGALAATSGCLVFGSLPRLRERWRKCDAALLGFGFGVHMLCRQFESLLLFFAIVLFFLPLVFRSSERRNFLRASAVALAAVVPVIVLILLQNRAVTHGWTMLPEQLSQYQYGVPTSLTIQQNPTPHVPLTPQQELDYKAQALMHGPDTDTPSRFLLRLEYRVRYYRFFFLPPLYIALIAFLFSLRDRRLLWIAITLLIFAVGTNLFPYLLVHYLAAVTCLFVLASVAGLQQISRLRIRNINVGAEIVRVLVLLCFAEFAVWYGLHLFESPAVYPILRYETWDSIGYADDRRALVDKQLAVIPGQLLVFVRYSRHHVYQDEWVWNSADIDSSRIVYARDLGPDDDKKLIRYYPHRKVLLLEPDDSPPKLSAFPVPET
jgi:4-amino-4-deoxy-L-arabinose transferase-like glycosyltransferase